MDYQGNSKTIDVENGLTVMEGAIQNDIPGIDADCGGAAVCGTCHCFIDTLQAMPTVDEQEAVMLGLRPDQEDSSRLACQVQVTDDMSDFTVRLPEFQM